MPRSAAYSTKSTLGVNAFDHGSPASEVSQGFSGFSGVWIAKYPGDRIPLSALDSAR
jgi:hypothetical protein